MIPDYKIRKKAGPIRRRGRHHVVVAAAVLAATLGTVRFLDLNTSNTDLIATADASPVLVSTHLARKPLRYCGSRSSAAWHWYTLANLQSFCRTNSVCFPLIFLRSILMTLISRTPAWDSLKEHWTEIAGLRMRDLFDEDPRRRAEGFWRQDG